MVADESAPRPSKSQGRAWADAVRRSESRVNLGQTSCVYPVRDILDFLAPDFDSRLKYASSSMGRKEEPRWRGPLEVRMARQPVTRAPSVVQIRHFLPRLRK